MVQLEARLALLAVLTISQTFAAPASIGTASARGGMRVDGSNVYGNATVFEGTLIETAKATTDLRMQRGAELLLAIDSRGKFYGDRMVLERGETEVRKSGNLQLQANNLMIVPVDQTSKGVVSMKSANRVQVSAMAGGFNVSTPSGLLLAKVVPGLALEFDGQAAGASAPIRTNGTLSKEEGHFFLTTGTGVKYELTGRNFDSQVGKNVTILGTPDPTSTPHLGATSVLVVSNSRGAVVAAGAAGAGAAGAAGGAAAAGGLAGGAIAAITIGAVAAGTGLGIGVYEATKSDASR